MSGHGVTLTLQRVAEPKTGKNRMHLDLLVENLEQEVHRLESIGASASRRPLARSSVRRGSCSWARKATSSA